MILWWEGEGCTMPSWRSRSATHNAMELQSREHMIWFGFCFPSFTFSCRTQKSLQQVVVVVCASIVYIKSRNVFAFCQYYYYYLEFWCVLKFGVGKWRRSESTVNCGVKCGGDLLLSFILCFSTLTFVLFFKHSSFHTNKDSYLKKNVNDSRKNLLNGWLISIL